VDTSILHRVLLGLLLCTSSVTHAADVQTISHGERVDLTDHLADGKLTLVDFYADWCGPCRSLAPTLDRLASENPDRLALRKVDVSNWGSPVATQFGIRSIPHLKLFDEDGALIGEGNAGAVLQAARSRLGRSGSAGPSAPVAIAKHGRSPWPAVIIVGALAVAAVLYFRRKPNASSLQENAPRPATPPPMRASDLKVRWFVMLGGSLEGPYSAEELDDLRSRGLIDGHARVRRRGDSAWRDLGEVLRDAELE